MGLADVPHEIYQHVLSYVAAEICIESAGIGCIACIIGGAYELWGSLKSCNNGGSVMDVCLKVNLLFWQITVVCARLSGKI